MSSTGQIVGGIVGGIVGFFTPIGVVQGAAIGMSIGGYIDPPPGPDIVGPTLDDKSFQSTAYGVSLPTLYGTIATTGNIFYLENNEYLAVAKKEQTGGKGGGPEGSYTTTTYYATFAVALGEAMPGSAVRRIWAGGKLIYSMGTDDLLTFLQSAKSAEGWRYYDGSQQYPDARMEAVLGVGRTPSYEGTAYIIFYDFDLTEYGNGMAGCPIKVELVEQVEPSIIDLGAMYLPAAMETLIDVPGLPSSMPVYTWCMTLELVQSHYVYTNGAGDDLEVMVFDASSNPLGEYVYKTRPGTELPSQDVDPYYNFGETDNPDARYWYEPVENLGAFPTRFVQKGGVTAAFNHELEMVYLRDGGVWSAVMVDDVRAIAITDRYLIVVSCPLFLFTESPCLFSVFDFDLTLVNSFTIQFDDTQIDDGQDYKYPRLCADRDFVYFVGNAGNQNIKVAKVNFITGEFVFSYPIAFDQPHSGGIRINCFSMVVAGNLLIISRVNFSESYWVGHHRFILDPVQPYPAQLSDIVSGQLARCGLPPESVDVTALESDVDGYRFSGPGSARGALGPLQVAYLFDLVELGYTLTAVNRGGAADEVVPLQHLNARQHSESPGVLINREREIDSQLPSRYSITYMDYAREYDSNTQYADYPSRGVNERNQQLPVVMSATAAAKLADVLINLAWMERDAYVFTVPQIYLHWKIANVKTVEVSPGIFATLRINAITQTPDQRLEINAKLAEPSLYQSSAAGAVVAPPSELVPYVGTSRAVLLDIPMILDSTDIPGYVVAMYSASGWPGAVWMRSIDYGQTYSAVQAFNGQTTIATCDTVLGVHDGYVIDREGTLTITEISGEFAAITEAQMLTGQHYCAYGKDGRWEIMRYADAQLEGSGQKTLSIFARGLRGTEWATGLHQEGDYLVLLSDPDNIFIATDLTALGVIRYFKAVTLGQNSQDVQPYTHLYEAVNLKPLSPVLPVGELVGTDWHVSWTPRTRYTSTWWVTGVQPQNEVPMGWEIDVMDGVDIKRTLVSATPDVVYTLAQQVVDFGGAQSSITLNIYQKSERVGFGFPLEVTL